MVTRALHCGLVLVAAPPTPCGVPTQCNMKIQMNTIDFRVFSENLDDVKLPPLARLYANCLKCCKCLPEDVLRIQINDLEITVRRV